MPLRHRTKCAALATASDWIFNFMIVQITPAPVSISNIGWKTYMIFFVLNAVFALVVYLLLPETSGRTLEEIDLLFSGDCDRLFVVDRRGVLLPGFRSRMNRVNELEFLEQVSSGSSSKEEGGVEHEELKGSGVVTSGIA